MELCPTTYAEIVPTVGHSDVMFDLDFRNASHRDEIVGRTALADWFFMNHRYRRPLRSGSCVDSQLNCISQTVPSVFRQQKIMPFNQVDLETETLPVDAGCVGCRTGVEHNKCVAAL